MFFDNEDNILEFARSSMMSDSVFLFNGNSFNKKIQRCLLDESKLVSDNNHSSLPPDYCSPAYNMMFDVLRVNDSEIKRTYNPVKMREQKQHNKISEKLDGRISSDTEIMVISESDNIRDHTYKSYVKNGQRVIDNHIKKIPLWQQKWPHVKHKGLFIFDETEVYYEGISMPSGCSDPDKSWLRGVDVSKMLHEPWLDRKLIQQIYKAPLDFVVWFCPYKPFGIAMKIDMRYPSMVIVDTRFHFDGYIDYPNDLVC